MKINETFYFMVKDPHDTLFIDEDDVDKLTDDGINPILWCRNGLFCLIPKEVIQNAMNIFVMFRQTEVKFSPPVISFLWSQGIPISNLAGRALVRE